MNTLYLSLSILKYPNNKSANVKLSNGPLIRQRQINQLVDLKPFFDMVTSHAFVHNSAQSNLINNYQYQQTQNLLTSTNLRLFEATVHEDFLEGWSPTWSDFDASKSIYSIFRFFFLFHSAYEFKIFFS